MKNWAHVRLRDEDGTENAFLLALEEFHRALERAPTQNEDLPPEGWLQKFQDLLD